MQGLAPRIWTPPIDARRRQAGPSQVSPWDPFLNRRPF